MKKHISNSEIIWAFEKALAAEEIIGGSIYVLRAYQNAIETLKSLNQELAQLVYDQKLTGLPGIGKEFSQKISDLVLTGHSRSLDKLYRQVPEAIFALIKIPGIGPKKAYRLATALKLNDEKTAASQLKAAAKAGKIQVIEGFGVKSEQQILLDISKLRPKSNRLRLDQAEILISPLITLLKSLPQVIYVDILGSLRRGQETVGDLDIGIATRDVESVIKAIKLKTPEYAVKVQGENVIRCLLPGNKQADIKFQVPEKYGATLQHFTGSKQHNIALREYALKQQKSLSEHGIKFRQKLFTYSTETKFYQALGLAYIPPELRENRGEIEAASNQQLPQLVKLSEIKGDFHTHTDFPWQSSHDRGDSISNLLNVAHSLNYSWLVLGDHNPSKKTYNPSQIISQIIKRNRWLDEQYIKWKNNMKINSTLKILKGMEVDILKDGTLSVPDDGLHKLDCVHVSIHSSFNLDKNAQTKRFLNALKHPQVKFIGHPLGRLIFDRTGIDADWELIFKACLSSRIALEINADPHRLDLPDNWVRLAVDMGVMLALGSDAHVASALTNLRYGVSVARRGWAQSQNILNTYPYEKLQKWL